MPEDRTDAEFESNEAFELEEELEIEEIEEQDLPVWSSTRCDVES
jgi:hypothetical protein